MGGVRGVGIGVPAAEAARMESARRRKESIVEEAD